MLAATESRLPTHDRWLSVVEISSYVGVKPDTVYKWINRRRFPAHKVGRLWKFRRLEVDRWVLSGSAGTRRRADKDHAAVPQKKARSKKRTHN